MNRSARQLAESHAFLNPSSCLYRIRNSAYGFVQGGYWLYELWKHNEDRMSVEPDEHGAVDNDLENGGRHDA